MRCAEENKHGEGGQKVVASIEASHKDSIDLTALQLRQVADETFEAQRRQLNIIVSRLAESSEDIHHRIQYAMTCDTVLSGMASRRWLDWDDQDLTHAYLESGCTRPERGETS